MNAPLRKLRKVELVRIKSELRIGVNGTGPILQHATIVDGAEIVRMVTIPPESFLDGPVTDFHLKAVKSQTDTTWML